MATINLTNTGNLDVLSIGDSEEQSSGFTVQQGLNSLLNNFPIDYTSLTATLIGWEIDYLSQPAGGSLFTVGLTNGIDSFEVTGTLVNNGSNFTLSGSTLFLKKSDGFDVSEYDVITTTNLTLQLTQTDPGKIYNAATTFYTTGNTSTTTFAALPAGATVTSISAIPTSFSQIGSFDDNTQFLLRGSFTLSGSQFSGTATSLQATDEESGTQYNFSITGGTLLANGTFSSSATLNWLNQIQSTGDLRFDFSTNSFIFPAGSSSTSTITGASIPFTTDFGLVIAQALFGNDTFNVNSTTDVLIFAGAGNDTVNTGSGNDIVFGGTGDDTVNAGAGNDLYVFTVFGDGEGRDFFNGGAGNDTVSFEGNLNPSSFSDDRLNLILPSAAAGGYSNLSNTGLIGFEKGVDRVILRDVENIEFIGNNYYYAYDIRPLYVRSAGNDVLYSMTASQYNEFSLLFNHFDGSPFNNSTYSFNFSIRNIGGVDQWRYSLNGGAGNDILYGTSGSGQDVTAWYRPDNGDRTALDSGRDILDGGTGNDTMIGFAGSDIYMVDSAGDVVIENAWDNGFDTVYTTTSYALSANTSVERMLVHQLIPNAQGNLFAAFTLTPPPSQTAPISLTGSNYTFELLGNDGVNIIRAGELSGLIGINKPENVSGAVLLGMGGNDQLIGGNGNDHLFGGSGNDALQGGAGNDHFYLGFLFADGQTARALLPQYFLLNDLGLYDNPESLTGGDDIAFGGDGWDTVVVGTRPAGSTQDFESRISYQRVSETQILISTAVDSIRVDQSMEAVRYLVDNGDDTSSPQTVWLPWVVTLNEQQRDIYYANYSKFLASVEGQGELSSPFAFVPASNFSDFVDLNAYRALYDEFWAVSTFDGGAGNDVIYGQRFSIGQEPLNSPLITTIKGGAGDDWIYGGGFYTTFSENLRYELHGDAGNDTLTLNASLLGRANEGASIPRVLLDGGIGNDHYRIALQDLEEREPGNPQRFDIEIVDSAGLDRLTVALDPGDDGPGWYISWTQEGLRVLERETNHVVLRAGLNTIEQFFISEDSKYFEPLLGGNLINPTAVMFSTGVMTGTAGNDVLLPIAGVSLRYDGGAGDDLIILNGIANNVAIGGLGNNTILVDSPLRVTSGQTLGYSWTGAGFSSEVDLRYGYAYVLNAQGNLVATDRFDGDGEEGVQPFRNVIGGAGNDRMFGNQFANQLDGGAGDDILYSGRNSGRPTTFDTLIGGLGNDILIEETHWGRYTSPQPLNFGYAGSRLEGGAGNDTYVILHNGTLPYSTAGINGFDTATINGNDFTFERIFRPTQIIERTATGSDAGGQDTIRFVNNVGGVESLRYIQTGNLVTVFTPASLNFETEVGKNLLINFLSGSGLNNAYTVENIERDDDDNIVSFQFTAPTTINQTGSLMTASDINLGESVNVWLNNDQMMNFNLRNTPHNNLYNIEGAYDSFQTSDFEYFKSDLSIFAVTDRIAWDWLEVGSRSAESAGLRMKVSFNSGTTNQAEVIFAGSNGNAVLFGGEGTDYILDTFWDDILVGGNGNDQLSSNFGADIMIGGAGNDLLRFRSDNQVMSGGSGTDTFMFQGVLGGNAIITDFSVVDGDQIVFYKEWLYSRFLQEVIDTNGLQSVELKVLQSPRDFSYYLNLSYSETTERFDLFKVARPFDVDQVVAVRDTVGQQLDDQLEEFFATNNFNYDGYSVAI